MKVNLAKVFPKSSAKSGLCVLIINTEDIVKLERSNSDGKIMDFVDIGILSYKFPTEDDGLVHLNNIMLAEKVIALFESNADDTSLNESSKIEIAGLCRSTLNYYTKQYQCTE